MGKSEEDGKSKYVVIRELAYHLAVEVMKGWISHLKGSFPQQKTSLKITLDFHNQRNSRKTIFFLK